MLSLPSKPWKKVKIETVSERRHRIVLLTEACSEADFLRVVEEDLRPSLGAGDALDGPDFASRSVMLTTGDLRTFRRNLVFACVMVEVE